MHYLGKRVSEDTKWRPIKWIFAIIKSRLTPESFKIYHSYLRSTAMSNTCSFIINNIYRFRKVHDGINSVIGTVKYLIASNQKKTLYKQLYWNLLLLTCVLKEIFRMIYSCLCCQIMLIKMWGICRM